jgi:hypothetical protein
MTTINVCNGQYTIIQNNNPWEFKALRNGEEWRDLTGDNLILALCYRIEDMQKLINQCKDTFEKIIPMEDKLNKSRKLSEKMLKLIIDHEKGDEF